MKNKYAIAGAVIFLIVALYHLLTLSIVPQPWGDEIFFNSVSLDFLRNGTFIPSMDTIATNRGEALHYGPIFFMLNALVMKLFGIGPFQGRIVELLFGLALIVTIGLVMWDEIKNKKIWFLVFLAWVLDPFFNSGLNQGRMDDVASFFFFIAGLYIFRFSETSKNKLLIYFLSGVFLGLCLLTTLRFALFVPAFAVVAAVQFFKSDKKILIVKRWLFLAITVVAVFSVWVFGKFGSYPAFFEYVFWMQGSNEAFLGGNFWIAVENYPIIITTLVLIGVTLLTNRKSLLENDSLFFLTVVICFYALVGETGPYSVIVIPYFYLLIAKILHVNESINSRLAKATRYIILGSIIFNIGIFCLRGVVQTADYPARNYGSIKGFIQQNIPEGSRVVADEIYYYAVLSSGSDFQSYIYTTDFIETERRRREEFDYEYLFVSNRIHKRLPDKFEMYASHSKLVKVAEYKSEHLQLLSKLSKINPRYEFSSTGYDGVLYRRVKETPNP